MAANIPAKLKQAGITPFVVRGAQLEKAKPLITYWCDYWVVNQILAKGLHNADEECLQFTTTLMDKLEQTKGEHAGEEIITDDEQGRAYVEQFAEETFQRALRPLKANKVTHQTAGTFEAAATFLSLVNIWHPPDVETAKKIKFCKWNAARILKAIKAGEDPNESNPKMEEERTDDAALDQQLEQELQAMGSAKPATVEDAPDEENKSNLQPPAPQTFPVSAPTSPPQATGPAPEEPSPLAPPNQAPPDSYFPSAPAATEDDPPVELPSAPGAAPSLIDRSPDATTPSSLGAPSPAPPTTDAISPPTLPDTPQSFYRPQPPPPPPPTRQDTNTSLPPPVIPPAQQPQNPYPPYQPTPPPAANPYYAKPSQPVVPTFTPPPAPQQQTPVAPVSSFSGAPPTNAAYNADDMAMVQAQKHAKWAISALNFEDVPTAVRELREALKILGAS